MIANVTYHKHLGIILDQRLSWTDHINSIYTESFKKLNIMKKLKFSLDRKSLEIFYKAFIRPRIEYGNIIYFGTSNKNLDKIIKLEKEAKRIVTGATFCCNTALLDIECGWIDIITRCKNHCLIMMYKILNGLCPKYLENILESIKPASQNYNLRRSYINLPKTRTETFKRSFFPSTIRLWNSLPLSLIESRSLNIF